MKNLLMYNERRANKKLTWILFLFLGWSYGSMEKIGIQILFYLTLGGFGIWALIRLFTLNSAIREYNYNIAKEVGLSEEDIKQLGLIKS